MDLLEIVKDYELNFDKKQCTVYTGYKKLPEFTVLFDMEDLFHLLGIHKLNTGLRSSSWLKAVKEGNFQLEKYFRHPAFNNVRPRIKNYEFIYEIFYQDRVKVCVLEKDLDRNTMKLSVVFYKEQKKRIVVIGLRKDKLGYFRPVTLHESRNNPYSGVKKTFVKGIEWENG